MRLIYFKFFFKKLPNLHPFAMQLFQKPAVPQYKQQQLQWKQTYKWIGRCLISGLNSGLVETNFIDLIAPTCQHLKTLWFNSTSH